MWIDGLVLAGLLYSEHITVVREGSSKRIWVLYGVHSAYGILTHVRGGYRIGDVRRLTTEYTQDSTFFSGYVYNHARTLHGYWFHPGTDTTTAAYPTQTAVVNADMTLLFLPQDSVGEMFFPADAHVMIR